MAVAAIETGSSAQAPLEKVPLETYVPPAKPSLIGLSRTEIAESPKPANSVWGKCWAHQPAMRRP